MAKLMKLEKWWGLIYDDPYEAKTVRKWAREGKLFPAPIKHGRDYYIHGDARYIECVEASSSKPNESKTKHKLEELFGGAL